MEIQPEYYQKASYEIPRKHLILNKCYICGSQDFLTREHVIPKIIFRPFEPTNPLILSACNKCNQAKGFNETFAVRSLQMTSFSKQARSGFAEAIRGFQKGHGLGLRENMLRRIEKKDFYSPGGILLGKVDHLNTNAGRINDFFVSISKGFVTTHSLQIQDWNTYTIKLKVEQSLTSNTIFTEPIFKEIMGKSRFSQYWRNIFFYAGDFSPTGDSIWIMSIYGSHNAAVSFTKNS